MVVIMIIIIYLNYKDKLIEYIQEDIFWFYKYFISVLKCKKCCKVKEKKMKKNVLKKKIIIREFLFIIFWLILLFYCN